MRFETEIRGTVATFHLKGRFITGCEAELRPAQAFLRQNSIDQAVLDFSEVPYIDSTGLAFVVELHKTMQSRGGTLVVANPSDRVREVLTLTRISEIISVRDGKQPAAMSAGGTASC